MQKKERAKKVKNILDRLFPHPTIPLYHTNSYTLLIAVLLSAHSTDKAVNKITPALFRTAPTPQKMVLLTQQKIEAIIRPCGLYKRKAKAIVALSSLLIKEHGGKIPSSLEALEKLPGVGHKTASVVLSHAFHQPAFAVDTHIFRCAKRWKLSSGQSLKTTEKDLKKIFNKRDWGKIHLQMILYARAFCPARGHRIEKCPICQAVS